MTIKVNDGIDIGDFIIVISEYDNFMEYKPPCEECLVCNMCIKEIGGDRSLYSDGPYLYLKLCDKLKNFINKNELFIKVK